MSIFRYAFVSFFVYFISIFVNFSLQIYSLFSCCTLLFMLKYTQIKIYKYTGGVSMNIMENLLRLMNERNLSAGCLADRLGINLRQIEEWKSRDTDIPVEYILPICRTLHITAYELLNSNYNCISNDDETELISCYWKCTPHDRTIIRNLASRFSNISNNGSTPPREIIFCQLW